MTSMPAPCRGLLPSYYCSVLACCTVISTHVGHISCLANMFVHKHSGATSEAAVCEILLLAFFFKPLLSNKSPEQ